MKRVTQSMKAVAVNPWFASILGSLIIGFAGFMLYRFPAQWKVWCGVGLFGCAILPRVLPFVAANLRPLVTLWKSSKANGAGGESKGQP